MSDPNAERKATRYEATLAALTLLYSTARADILARIKAGHLFDALRIGVWRPRVARVYADELKITATEIGGLTSVELAGDREPSFDPDRMTNYLDKVGENRAERWERLVQGMIDRIDVTAADILEEARQETLAMQEALAEEDARDNVTTSANFGTIEAGKAEGATAKVWRTIGPTTRPEHIALDGFTELIDAPFPNGLYYPGDAGPPAQRVNCDCYLVVTGAGR